MLYVQKPPVFEEVSNRAFNTSGIRSSKYQEKVLEYENGAYVKQNAFNPKLNSHAK